MIDRSLAAIGRSTARRIANALAPLLIAWGSAACSVAPTPIPIQGDAADLSQLVGEWHGEYQGLESGRTGRLSFTLEAGADTAFGYVLMRPAGIEHPIDEMAAWIRAVQPRTDEEEVPVPQRLEIAFVRAEAGMIEGVLAGYRDPECGCALETTFRGTVEDDVMEGTFLTRHRESGLEHHGTWRVVRDSD